jgi:hypothetical protein
MLVLLMGRFLKYAVEIGSGVMIYLPSFMKTGCIQKLTQTARRSHKATFIFFKIRKVG